VSARRILADTGAWLALFHRRDQHHEAAAAEFRALRERRAELVITDLIVAELYLHLLRGFGPAIAREYVRAVKTDPLVTELYADRALQDSAFSDWLERFDDQAFSFADAVSFAVMAEQGIRRALSFDERFRIAGFETIPERRGS
jgi:predicted nucleic acid-binding protein